MCNLCGAYGDMWQKHVDTVRNALFVGQLRGFDSTGLGVVKDDTLQVVKRVLPASDFLDLKSVDKAANMNSTAFIGHNRYATQGGITISNAHPFIFGNSFMGAHNGTLTNKHDLHDHAKFGTDSEALLYNIYKFGAAEVLPKVKGAYALVWWDTDSLNFARNYERTLFWAYDDLNKAILWSSEEEMLDFAAKRANNKLKEIQSFDPHTIYTFKLSKAKNFGEEDLTKVKYTSNPLSYKTTHYLSDYTKKPDKPGAGSTSSSNVLPLTPPPYKYKDKKKENRARLDAYKGFGGKLLYKSEFAVAVSNGCAFCGSNITWGEIVRFLDNDLCLCDQCIKLPKVTFY